MTPEFPRAPRKQGARRCTEAAFSHGGGLLLPQLGGGGADGQAHVGARVPVGDREDVELIDLLLLRVDGRRRRG